MHRYVISYSLESYTSKLEYATVSTTGVTKTPGRSALEQCYPELVDVKVNVNGQIGTVIEFHSRKRKYPFIVKTANGSFKLTEYDIERLKV